MSRLARLAFFLAFLLALLPASASAQPSLPGNCALSPSNTGSLWLVCAPTGAPNGDLVVFAHGYVDPGQPLTAGFDQLILSDGATIPGLVTSLGYYFAASSYPKNGLAVREGLADTKAMVDVLRAQLHPTHVYLVGASEGGLVTTLGVERYPTDFSGGLSTCGPIGSFRGQVNYFGDFRVIFDYFFPGLLPPSPVSIPKSLIDNWFSVYAGPTGRVASAMAANPTATNQLLKVTHAATSPSDPSSKISTAEQVLWYNVFSTNEAKVELGGQPFGNRDRVYVGSTNNLRLNLRVQRFMASRTALANIDAYYQTSGRLRVPLITMHTTGDPVVPYWQEPLYTAKTIATGSARMHVNIPIAGYGHCSFTTAETLGAFALLVYRVTGQPLPNPQIALPTAASRAEFATFAGKVGALR